jgi:hypothetical protein
MIAFIFGLKPYPLVQGDEASLQVQVAERWPLA